MIVVDSSVWIDYFIGAENTQTNTLHARLGNQPVAAGDLILAEVLQGFRKDKDFKNAKMLFESVRIFEMLDVDIAIKSAENFRKLRKKGITVRKTIDTIIATYCIEENIPLLYSDRDFKPFVKHLGLQEA